MPHTTSPGFDATLLHVLLVCPRGEHLERVRSLASRWPQAAQVHWTPDPEAAMSQALACPPDLVIVDARLDRASEVTLGERLRHGRPDLVVMHFGEPGATQRSVAGSHWHWSELTRATGWWVQRRFGARTLAEPGRAHIGR